MFGFRGERYSLDLCIGHGLHMVVIIEEIGFPGREDRLHRFGSGFAPEISHRDHVKIRVKKVLVRDVNKARSCSVPMELLTTNPNDVLVPTLFTCIAADGQLSEGEWKFICSFIGGYSREQAFATAGEFYCDEAHRVVRDFIRAFPSNVAEAYICMCLAVLSVDRRIDGYEVEFLNTIL